MSWSRRGLWGAAIAGAVALSGCTSVVCGSDTREENGKCVPDGLAHCGAGTALVGGECKPVCAAGLTAGTNGCVVSDAVCGPGTELVAGTCHTADPMKAVTDAEGAEPNDSAQSAKRFELPAAGAAPRVLGGIVDAVQDGKADFDWFVFQAAPLARVHIQAQAVGAPAVGVVLEPAGGEPSLRRYVIDLSARDSSRDVTLPVGGDWVVKVSELSNLNDFLPGLPRGGKSFSYAVQVSQLPAATSKKLGADGTADGMVGDGDVFDVAGNGSSTQLLQLSIAPPEGGAPFPGARALWATDAEGTLVLDATDTVSTSGQLTAMDPPRLVVPPGGVRLGVDYLFALGDPKTPYHLTSTPVPMEELTPPFPVQAQGTLDQSGVRIYSLDVAADSVITAKMSDIGYDVEGRLELRDSRFRLVAEDEDYYLASASTFVPKGKEGRYFIVVIDRFPRASDTDLGYSLSVDGAQAAEVGPVAVPGSAQGSVQVPQGGTGWFAVYPGDKAMLTLTLVPEAGMAIAASGYSSQLTQVKPKQQGGAGETVVLDQLYSPGTDVMLVKVESAQGGAVSLQAEAQAPTFAVETEPNNSIAQAEPLAMNGADPAEVAGFLDPNDDQDFFKIVVPSGANVKLSMSTKEGILGGTPDTYLTFYDQSGTKIDEDDDGGPGLFSLVEKDGVAPGTYYVAVKYAPSAFSHTKRDYTLDVAASVQ